MMVCAVLFFLVFQASMITSDPIFETKLLPKNETASGITYEVKNYEDENMQKLRALPQPCSCEALLCNCCMNMELEQLNINEEACMDFGFDPRNFALLMRMRMNDNVFFERSVSGRNPPPLCIPIPITGMPIPRIDSCVRLYDIYFPEKNIHMCFDWEVKLEGITLFIIHFDCMRMGADGLAVMKPGEEVELGGERPGQGGITTEGDEDSGYDVVEEV